MQKSMRVLAEIRLNLASVQQFLSIACGLADDNPSIKEPIYLAAKEARSSALLIDHLRNLFNHQQQIEDEQQQQQQHSQQAAVENQLVLLGAAATASGGGPFNGSFSAAASDGAAAAARCSGARGGSSLLVASGSHQQRAPTLAAADLEHTTSSNTRGTREQTTQLCYNNIAAANVTAPANNSNIKVSQAQQIINQPQQQLGNKFLGSSRTHNNNNNKRENLQLFSWSNQQTLHRAAKSLVANLAKILYLTDSILNIESSGSGSTKNAAAAGEQQKQQAGGEFASSAPNEQQRYSTATGPVRQLATSSVVLSQPQSSDTSSSRIAGGGFQQQQQKPQVNHQTARQTATSPVPHPFSGRVGVQSGALSERLDNVANYSQLLRSFSELSAELLDLGFCVMRAAATTTTCSTSCDDENCPPAAFARAAGTNLRHQHHQQHPLEAAAALHTNNIENNSSTTTTSSFCRLSNSCTVTGAAANATTTCQPANCNPLTSGFQTQLNLHHHLAQEENSLRNCFRVQQQHQDSSLLAAAAPFQTAPHSNATHQQQHHQQYLYHHLRNQVPAASGVEPLLPTKFQQQHHHSDHKDFAQEKFSLPGYCWNTKVLGHQYLTAQEMKRRLESQIQDMQHLFQVNRLIIDRSILLLLSASKCCLWQANESRAGFDARRSIMLQIRASVSIIMAIVKYSVFGNSSSSSGNSNKSSSNPNDCPQIEPTNKPSPWINLPASSQRFDHHDPYHHHHHVVLEQHQQQLMHQLGAAHKSPPPSNNINSKNLNHLEEFQSQMQPPPLQIMNYFLQSWNGNQSAHDAINKLQLLVKPFAQVTTYECFVNALNDAFHFDAMLLLNTNNRRHEAGFRQSRDAQKRTSENVGASTHRTMLSLMDQDQYYRLYHHHQNSNYFTDTDYDKENFFPFNYNYHHHQQQQQSDQTFTTNENNISNKHGFNYTNINNTINGYPAVDFMLMSKRQLIATLNEVFLGDVKINLIERAQEFTDCPYTKHEHRESILLLIQCLKFQLMKFVKLIYRLRRRITSTMNNWNLVQLRQFACQLDETCAELKYELQTVVIEQSDELDLTNSQLDLIKQLKQFCLAGDTQRVDGTCTQFREQCEQLVELCKMLNQVAPTNKIKITTKTLAIWFEINLENLIAMARCLSHEPRSKVAKDCTWTYHQVWCSFYDDFCQLARQLAYLAHTDYDPQRTARVDSALRDQLSVRRQVSNVIGSTQLTLSSVKSNNLVESGTRTSPTREAHYAPNTSLIIGGTTQPTELDDFEVELLALGVTERTSPQGDLNKRPPIIDPLERTNTLGQASLLIPSRFEGASRSYPLNGTQQPLDQWEIVTEPNHQHHRWHSPSLGHAASVHSLDLLWTSGSRNVTEAFDIYAGAGETTDSPRSLDHYDGFGANYHRHQTRLQAPPPLPLANLTLQQQQNFDYDQFNEHRRFATPIDGNLTSNLNLAPPPPTAITTNNLNGSTSESSHLAHLHHHYLPSDWQQHLHQQQGQKNQFIDEREVPLAMASTTYVRPPAAKSTQPNLLEPTTEWNSSPLGQVGSKQVGTTYALDSAATTQQQQPFVGQVVEEDEVYEEEEQEEHEGQEYDECLSEPEQQSRVLPTTMAHVPRRRRRPKAPDSSVSGRHRRLQGEVAPEDLDEVDSMLPIKAVEGCLTEEAVEATSAIVPGTTSVDGHLIDGGEAMTEDKWSDLEASEITDDIMRAAKQIEQLAISMYQFTRGEGDLNTTQDLFTHAELFAERANELYKVVRCISYKVPAGNLKRELLAQLGAIPALVQQLQFTVKNPTVGKPATFAKVEGVIRETQTLMEAVNRVVTATLSCRQHYKMAITSMRKRTRTLSPSYRNERGCFDFDANSHGFARHSANLSARHSATGPTMGSEGDIT